jgi:hypothetical protein
MEVERIEQKKGQRVNGRSNKGARTRKTLKNRLFNGRIRSDKKL